MSCRVAIVDDSAADARFVGELLERWAASRAVGVRADRYPSAEAFLFALEGGSGYDMLLLDIEMGAMNGVELARRLRREDQRIQIVFITGYSDYLGEGYDVSALHYLIKPLHPDKLFSVLDRAMERLRSAERVLTLESGGVLHRIPLSAITHAEVHRNYVTVHAGEEHLVKKTLSELERELDGRFYRVGRSVLVNLGFIRRVTRSEIHLTEGTVIPLPRGAYEGLNRAIISMQ